MPQDALLFPHLDVMENLRFGGATREGAREVARSVGCAHLLDRRPRHLSGGEARRVSLARALLAARLGCEVWRMREGGGLERLHPATAEAGQSP